MLAQTFTGFTDARPCEREREHAREREMSKDSGAKTEKRPGGTEAFSSYLRVPIYGARPQFSVRARPSTPRRRLNAINDLISVITVLIYRELRGRLIFRGLRTKKPGDVRQEADRTSSPSGASRSSSPDR